MPTVLRVGPYRFFFYAGDGDEPAHVHVERDDSEAKVWLTRFASNAAVASRRRSSGGSNSSRPKITNS
ncbi:MAG: DUF4160 domain-containing protein [Pirellulaceae bacterium]|nr:DUF4160 domain-containing protein [Pirellulaceae bacterium]